MDITQMIFNTIMAIGTMISAFIAFNVYSLNKKEINPRLSVIPKKIKEDNDYYYEYSFSLVHLNVNDPGFPELRFRHDSTLWQFEIVNTSDFPAVEVTVSYSVNIKKAIIEFYESTGDLIDGRYETVFTVNREAKFDYIPAQIKVVEKVLYLNGEFLKADLVIHKLKTKKQSFIKKSITIDTYEHPGFHEINDGGDYYALLGVLKNQ